MTEEFIILFSVKDMTPVQPPPPPPVKGAVPLYNPKKIPLDKKHLLLTEEKNSSSAQRENPFRKAANGKDFRPDVFAVIESTKEDILCFLRVNALGLMYK